MSSKAKSISCETVPLSLQPTFRLWAVVCMRWAQRRRWQGSTAVPCTLSWTPTSWSRRSSVPSPSARPGRSSEPVLYSVIWSGSLLFFYCATTNVICTRRQTWALYCWPRRILALCPNSGPGSYSWKCTPVAVCDLYFGIDSENIDTRTESDKINHNKSIMTTIIHKNH